MAEETKAAAATQQVQESAPPSAAATTQQVQESAPPTAEATTEMVAQETPAAAVDEKETETVKETKTEHEKEMEMTASASFKEESNVVGELPNSEKKALDELKQLVQDALKKREFYAPVEAKKEDHKPAEEPKSKAVEEKKEDEKNPESKKEVEEVKKEEPEAAAAAAASEAKKEEPKAVEEEPKKIEEEAEKVEEPEPIEVVTAVAGEDGAKTVEAIEESVVAVASKVEEPAVVAEPEQEPELPPEEVSIYGIPLLADERSDTILLKFLRARDFKVKDAFTMLKNTVRWRKEFGVDDLVDEDLGNDWDKVIFIHGTDKEGHPVCYNVYGEFMDKELYQKTFSDEDKRNKFIKWVIQSLEKSVRKLDFSPTGISSIVQVNDLKNFPGLLKRELRQTTDKALQLLQDNYPEFVAKQVLINVPWWYLAFYTVISPFLTQRSKSKFVIASPAKSADTLFNYIAPEQVPLQYGGLTSQGKQDFSTADVVSEVTIKASSKQTVEFPVTEKCHFVWELRVIGWDVSYGAEFVPDAEDGYTVIVQKSKKITSPDEPVIFNGYKVGEPGKIVVTVDNTSSRKKKLLYRSKIIPLSD